jgi:putative peptide zinc metalloprotease protein
MASQMFSEHWYRVQNQKVALRSGVRARRQIYRGEVWRVLYDPFSHQFFRLRPAAYEFVARLTPKRTVEEVWNECLEQMPDEAPGQGEVIQLLAQLYLSNLLQLDLPPDAQQFFERYRKRKTKERMSYLSYIMFARFPLYDPDDLLNKLRPYAKMLYSKIGVLLWFAVVGFALKTALDNAGALMDQSQGVLAPSNLFLLYAGMVFIKLLHEFGHGMACKVYGGEVHTMGIMLMIFTPIPYVDATASWAFRERRRRILVGAGGMIFELFVAAIATFIWANTQPGTLNALAYNLMFIASVSTVLFNANPLLRYDGYYILSDLLDIPNLYQRSTQQLRYVFEGKLLGKKNMKPASPFRGEQITLAVYGILSGLYRLVVFGGIILFVSRRFLLAGIIMAAICVTSWIIKPTIKFIHYLITDPSLERNRTRAISVSIAGAFFVAALVGWVPFPSSFSAPGTVVSSPFTEVTARTSGNLVEIPSASAEKVVQGEPLVRLDDPEWIFSWRAEESAMQHSDALYRRALFRSTADLDVIAVHRQVMLDRLDRLQELRRHEAVQAPMSGLWVSGALENLKGIWVERGTVLGYVVHPSDRTFVAVISQDEARWLFDEAGVRRARVRLRGSAHEPLESKGWRVIPAEQRTLPSPALGWFGGGDVAVRQDAREGTEAARTFFEVRVQLPEAETAILHHGRTGRVRFRVAPESLWRQASRRVRQILRRER